MRPDDVEYMQLTPEFLAGFDWSGSPLTRDGFRRWARVDRIDAININPKKWPLLKAGQPVPLHMMLAFSEYISDVLKLGRYPIGQIAKACRPGPNAPDRVVRHRNLWRLGWADLFAFITRCRTVSDEAYCQDTRDVFAAARMIFQSVGAREGKAGDAEAAIAAGERIMRRSLDDYARSLLTLWKANENTVLFAIKQERNTSIRVGVSVLIPLSKAFYRRFCDGQAEDTDIVPGDLQVPSGHLMIGAAADNRDLDHRRSKADHSVPQFLTLLFQIASLCPLLEEGVYVDLIGFAGTDESRSRLEAYHFKDLGTKTPVTGKAVLELRQLRQSAHFLKDPKSLAQDLAVRATLQVYQATIRISRQSAG